MMAFDSGAHKMSTCPGWAGRGGAVRGGAGRGGLARTGRALDTVVGFHTIFHAGEVGEDGEERMNGRSGESRGRGEGWGEGEGKGEA